MWVRVLGSAAGGGFPQWNCNCPTCTAVRTGSRPCRQRTQSSIAVSADYREWFLFNASPDVHAQIESFTALHPRGGRTTPLRAVLLTDAELDHTLGLLLLRESAAIEVHATAAVYETLRGGSSVLSALERYCTVTWRRVVPGAAVALGGGLTYTAFDVPTNKHNRFGTGTAPGRVVGYRLSDDEGRTCVYLPGVQDLNPAVSGHIGDSDCLFIDGTCWSDDELVRLGLAGKRSRDMGHLPIGGDDGSLDRLSQLGIGRTIYIHMNNTNPILLDDSPERQAVADRGFDVSFDGMEVKV